MLPLRRRHPFPWRRWASPRRRSRRVAFVRGRAMRKDLFCGEVTAASVGQGNNKVRRLCWHLIHRGAVPLPLIGEGLSAVEVKARLTISNSTAARQRFARRNMEVSRPTLQVKPILDRAIVLPLEGKGDRSAVDEVTCTPAPLREAFIFHPKSARYREHILLYRAPLLPIAYCLLPTASPSTPRTRTGSPSPNPRARTPLGIQSARRRRRSSRSLSRTRLPLW